MLKKVLSNATAAGLLLTSAVASADVIDLFSTDQFITLPIVGDVGVISSNGSTPAPGSPFTVTGPDIIGGERDIFVMSSDDSSAEAIVQGGVLSLSSEINDGGSIPGPAETGVEFVIQWDGMDGDATDFDTTGLGGVDISELDGFLVEVLSSDGTGQFIVDIVDSDGDRASIGFTFIPVDSTGPSEFFFIDFGLFTGETPLAGFPVEFPALPGGVNPALDFDAISGIQLTVQGQGELDIRVSSIEVVPEPSSLALMGLALIGLAGLARKRRA